MDSGNPQAQQNGRHGKDMNRTRYLRGGCFVVVMLILRLFLLLFLLVLALLRHGLSHELLKGHVVSFFLGITLCL